MNIQEMHVAVNLTLQKIASNVNRNFDPEEIDWCLNHSINQFVQDNIRQELEEGNDGFQYDTVRDSALSTLIRTDVPLPVSLNELQKHAVGVLPTDLLLLLEGGSAGFVRNCDTAYTATSTAATVTEKVYSLVVAPTTKSTGPFYENTELRFNNTVIPLVWPESLEAVEMNFVLNAVLKNNLSKIEELTSAKVYWEWYKDINIPNSIIIVTEVNSLSLNLLYDGVNHNAVLDSTRTLKRPGSLNSTAYSPLRRLKIKEVMKLSTSAFAKSIYASPICYTSAGCIKVLYDNNFIVNNVFINYIRKPKIVSLSLGYNCDLNPDFHERVCDMTAEFIKLTIGDPNYQWKAQDNNKNK